MPITIMLNLFSNRKSVSVSTSDYPADNPARTVFIRDVVKKVKNISYKHWSLGA